MSHRAVLRFLCLLGVFFKGETALIASQQTVMAAIGHNASFNCQLTQYKDVKYVMWVKLILSEEKILAVQRKNSQDVNSEYKAKVEFKYAGLMNSSMIIKHVTDQDEGCYRCVFNTYPDDVFNATTCLQLYELHEPFLQVTESTSSEELVVSCSATGRPAPTVTLTVPHHNSTSVTNTNGTVTVTTTAVLSRLHVNSTQVGCAVRVLSGPQIVVNELIPEVKPADGFDVESGSNNRWIIVGVVVGLCVAAAAAFVFYKYKHQNRQRPQSNTPGDLETFSVLQGNSDDDKEDTHEHMTPLMKNKLRLWTSTGNNKNIVHPKSSMKGRNLFPVQQDNPQD